MELFSIITYFLLLKVVVKCECGEASKSDGQDGKEIEITVADLDKLKSMTSPGKHHYYFEVGSK